MFPGRRGPPLSRRKAGHAAGGLTIPTRPASHPTAGWNTSSRPGAGWYGTIGEGTVTFRLPYERDRDERRHQRGAAPIGSPRGRLLPSRARTWSGISRTLKPTIANNVSLVVLAPATLAQDRGGEGVLRAANPGFRSRPSSPWQRQRRKDVVPQYPGENWRLHEAGRSDMQLTPTSCDQDSSEIHIYLSIYISLPGSARRPREY